MAWPIRFYRSTKLAWRLFGPYPHPSRWELTPEVVFDSFRKSTLGQTVQIPIVVKRGCLLHELKHLEHPLARFPVHFPELHSDARARIKSGHHSLCRHTGIIHRESQLDLATGSKDRAGFHKATAQAAVGEIAE